MKTFVSKSATETLRFGRRLGRTLRGGDIIALCGELGSGKTVLAKGIAGGLGVRSSNQVNSPSFVIIKEYKGRLPLYHFDVYRLDDVSGFVTIDYPGYFYGKGISVIEWGDKIISILPKDFLRIDMSVRGRNERGISLSPYGRRYKKLAEGL
jgi:tRNA threonylcarbamoyladenosine biosynthesis protein TsaE